MKITPVQPFIRFQSETPASGSPKLPLAENIIARLKEIVQSIKGAELEAAESLYRKLKSHGIPDEDIFRLVATDLDPSLKVSTMAMGEEGGAQDSVYTQAIGIGEAGQPY